MNLPFEYQVFHTNGKCSKVSCQWKQCDGKARSETRKISVRGEEWYYHVLFKIRSFSHFYWTFAKSFVSHFRFWQKAPQQRARAHSGLPRKIIEKNFELNLWANLHFFILDYSLTLCSSSCHMNSTRSLEIKYYNLYCKTSVQQALIFN